MGNKLVDGELVELSAEEEQKTLAAWAENETAKQEALRIAAIKQEAQARIIAHLPGGSPDNFILKEINLMARFNELLDKKVDGVIAPDELVEMDSLRSLWKDKIKTIRSMSDIAETNGVSVGDFIIDLDTEGL